MKRSHRVGAALAASLLIGLSIVAAQVPPRDERRSGYSFMSRQTQAMQDDDLANPGMLAVLEGEELWRRREGRANRACADCHGDAADTMKGVAARYPAFDTTTNAPIDLAGRIAQCRGERQEASPSPRESAAALALETFVAHQSRGLPVTAGDDPRLASAIALGKQLYEQRIGQLNLSCAQCHDEQWGRILGSSPIPQAHPTGYPIYRLEWQSMGSLHRRLRNCMFGVRAETYTAGSPEFIAIELYLQVRARGMKVETPGVRP
jgi:sulfur-oxidizing protein SoxA